MQLPHCRRFALTRHSVRQKFGRNANELIKQAAKRQQELKDPQLRDDLAAARAVLKKHSTMLLTASKVYVRHPELDLAKVNRDFVLKQVCEAVNTISDVAQGKSRDPTDMYSGAGELAAALDDFDVSKCTLDESLCQRARTDYVNLTHSPFTFPSIGERCHRPVGVQRDALASIVGTAIGAHYQRGRVDGRRRMYTRRTP